MSHGHTPLWTRTPAPSTGSACRPQTLLVNGSNVASRVLTEDNVQSGKCNHLPLPHLFTMDLFKSFSILQVMGEVSQAGVPGLQGAPQHSPRPERLLPLLPKEFHRLIPGHLN